jgi:hypothetical protein
MAHPILFAVVGGLIASRIFMRMRMRRIYGHGGGCRHRFRHGPIDLGAPEGQHPFRGRGGPLSRFGRFRGFGRRFGQEEQPKPARDVVSALALNTRQQELYSEVTDKAKSWLSTSDLAEALALVGREPFDRSALEFLIGSEKHELVDDFEQLHHSLTADQRAALRDVTSA